MPSFGGETVPQTEIDVQLNPGPGRWSEEQLEAVVKSGKGGRYEVELLRSLREKREAREEAARERYEAEEAAFQAMLDAEVARAKEAELRTTTTVTPDSASAHAPSPTIPPVGYFLIGLLVAVLILRGLRPGREQRTETP